MVERRQKAGVPTRELLTYFDDAHQRALKGAKAVINGGKDAKLIAGLWRTQGDSMTRQLIDDFFASPDPWIRNNGYTVGRLVSEAGKLLARRVRSQPVIVKDWRAECREKHNGRCTNVYFHEAQIDADREREV